MNGRTLRILTFLLLVLFAVVFIIMMQLSLRAPVAPMKPSSSTTTSAVVSRSPSSRFATMSDAEKAVEECEKRASELEQQLKDLIDNQAPVASVESSSATPLWLVGRPTACTDLSRPLCRSQNIIWGRLDAVHTGEKSRQCPVRGSEVIGCDLEWSTGFGHHIHHVGHCLTQSLMKNLSVVLMDFSWSYGRGCAFQKTWSCFFSHFSPLCTTMVGMPPMAPGVLPSRRIFEGRTPVEAAYVYGPWPSTAYWVPNDLEASSALSVSYPDPPLFLKGLLMRYAFGLRQDFYSLLNLQQKILKIKRPFAAMHVRRGDKVGHEADFHGFEEYVEALDGMRKLNKNNQGKMQVFIATDEPKLLAEARKLYGDRYEFTSLPGVAEMAAVGFSRVQGEATKMTLCDIAWLSHADYLVGTFSSQISRLAFELMLTQWPERTYMYSEKGKMAESDKPLVVHESPTGNKMFRIANEKLRGLQVRVASLDSGWYYGA